MTEHNHSTLSERLAANRRGKLTRDQYNQVVGHVERMRRLRWLGVALAVGSPLGGAAMVSLGSGNSIVQFLALLTIVVGVGSGVRLLVEVRGNDQIRTVLEQRKVEGREVEISKRWWQGNVDRKTGKPIKYLGWTIPIAPGRYRIYFLQGTDHAISCETIEKQAGS